MLQVRLTKRDVLIWDSWGNIPRAAFTLGMKMILPSGRVCDFIPCKSTRSPALKPVDSTGYREWVRTPHGTEMLVEVEALEQPKPVSHEVHATVRLGDCVREN